MVNAWNALLPKNGLGTVRRKYKKTITVEQAISDKDERDRKKFIKDINNLKKPLAKKFYEE